MDLKELEPQIEARKIYEGLEKPNWAPWLRFDESEIAEHRIVFPEGQITFYDDAGNPSASLDTVRVNWDGNTENLTTWDDVAGTESSYSESHIANGNTIALLSMSIREDKKGEKLATRVIRELRSRFSGSDVEHIIGDFRPSGFGAYKSETGKLNFGEYVSELRDDGLPVDPWLRALTRLGVNISKIDKKAMVVEASMQEFTEYQQTYEPEKWWQVQDHNDVEELIEWHNPMEQLENVDEVWECGETGSWYIDRENDRAVYIESNIWGEIPIEREPVQPSAPNYHLESQEFDKLQREIVLEVKNHFNQKPGIYGAWIHHSHPFSNIIRTLEANTPEFIGIEKIVTDEIEQRSRFFALIDTRRGADRIIHATRISGAAFGDFEQQDSDRNEGQSTGFIAIDELIDSDQDFSLKDFLDYYEKRGVNLNSCISVETNFTVGEKVKTDIPGLRVSDLGYTALFTLLERKGLEPNRTSVFAFINENTSHSLGTVLGIEFEPLAGRDDLKVPGIEGGFDDRFWPVRIPITDKVVDIFTQLKEVAAAEVYFKN